jgi:putative transposase
MSNLAPELIYRRNLPHIQPPGATFFVTFRLAGSIPVDVLAMLHAEAERTVGELERLSDSPERAERLYLEERRFFGQWDAVLDQGNGPDWLRNPEIAILVADALRFFDGKRYDLLVYCILSNHVHVVFTPLQKSAEAYYSLAQIMHTVKGYSAGRANRLLDRTGAFWLHESYDHCVRGAKELERILAYVVNNPVKAGLVAEWQAWPWTSYKEAQAAGLWYRAKAATWCGWLRCRGRWKCASPLSRTRHDSGEVRANAGDSVAPIDSRDVGVGRGCAGAVGCCRMRALRSEGDRDRSRERGADSHR